MSEHRRKPPPPQGGGRAAARRAAQQPPGRRTASSRGSAANPAAHSEPTGHEPRQGGRAEARRASQRSGRRRASEASGAAAGGGAGGRGGGGRRGGGGGGPEGGRGRGRGGGTPAKKRLIDYPRANRVGWRRFVPSWKQVTTLCVGFIGLIVGASGVALALVNVPSESDAAKSQNNVYLWSNGKVMARDGETNRQNVTINEIPRSMQNAAIAAENASFRTDSGVDPMGIARAVFNMAKGGSTQGGSTITQQYVKNAMLSQQQTLDRKFKELFIAIKVGWSKNKEQILQGYLNTSYYGRGAYGIQAAAQAYYGIDAEKLDANQSAFLATVLKGADLYDPAGGTSPGATRAANTKRAEARWSWILDREVENHLLSKAQREKYRGNFPKPHLPKPVASKGGQIGYMMDTAKKYVLKHAGLSEAQFDKGGYTIRTTFDAKKTTQLEGAVKKVNKRYIDPEKRAKDKYVQFGGASVVPGDGKIVALYGGEGYDKGHFSNNADTFGVPVGSTWKPFVLAAAMEHGTARSGGPLSPDSRYNGDDHLKVKDAQGNFVTKRDNTPFFQENESNHPWGYIPLTKAMEQSVNTPFVQLGMDVGMSKVRDMAEAAGISPASFDKNLNPSFALGTSTPSAIRMADAYATFAQSGTKVEPYSVTKVTFQGEDLTGFNRPKQETAMQPNVANNVTKVLQNVIKNGTGKLANRLNMPAAGKTGTTDENKSAWFVGYTKQLSTAVTMFREDAGNPRQLSMNGVGGFDSIHGGALPTEVWTEYMLQAMKGVTPETFQPATPIGQKVDEAGMPTPTPTPTPSDSPSESPSEKPSDSASPTNSPSPSPTDTCSPWDVNCRNSGGTSNGGANGGGPGGPGGPGGDTGGTSPTPDPTDANGGGGLFGGPSG
ncbi:transglycosylase domain-containing protein [Streptomyces hygroscopicus]|uniref:transglycosylase domain-containing protein n=1 Tax=Streptomyces hygroscopicus TaxID=1912 RepID=UPI001FCB6ADB|nr:transglycosylase domain-containing protein [Streptomyces hygroscopicus]BDH16336.1 penicillin-binding protein [Streptomyces hygroscopicus]